MIILVLLLLPVWCRIVVFDQTLCWTRGSEQEFLVPNTDQLEFQGTKYKCPPLPSHSHNCLQKQHPETMQKSLSGCCSTRVLVWTSACLAMKNIIIFLPIPFRDRPSRTARTDVRRRLRTYLFTSCFFMAPSPNRNLESHESTKPSKSEPPQYTLILCHAKFAMQKKNMCIAES